MPGTNISQTQLIAYVLWFVFFVTWFGAGLWAARTTSRPGAGREGPYRFLTVIAFVMVYWPPRTALTPALWTLPEAAHWALIGVMLAGFAFCWWARLHLGKLWSGAITRKEGHHVVDTGPYGLVRHPIYTGLILSGTALAVKSGSVFNLLGVPIFVFGWWVKARLEETFLSEQLGPEAYAAYRRRVPMLVPFLPW